MRKPEINIENNILHFIHNDSDYLIDLDQLESVYFYKDCVCFYEDRKKMVRSTDFDVQELANLLLKEPNFMQCDGFHIVNLKLVQSHYIEKYGDVQGKEKNNVVIKFQSGREESITLNSWLKAEKLYHKIDEQLCKVKYVQQLCN